MSVDLKPCKSSQVESFGFDPGSKTLAVKFKNGGIYHYTGVDEDTHKAMCCCESVGKFLGSRIKGKFGFKKIGDNR